MHSVTQEQVDALDPLTYEVVRHRLWSVTDEMGEALKRMSGSPIVTDANDFDFAISDELGQEVQVGLYNTMLVGAVDLAIYWTLRHRAVNPGIAEGDMFLCNDPWVGGGLHQNDVIVYQPVFHDGKLFAWTSAIAHQPDLGGVGLGSFSPAAQDVFSESLPTPPVKVVRGRPAAARRRRPLGAPLPRAHADRAGPAGQDRRQQRRRANGCSPLIDQYGADTVKAVMKRMMADAESRLRGQAHRACPTAAGRPPATRTSPTRATATCTRSPSTTTKTGDHLTFDFTGTDPQAGVINCTYAGMRGGVMLALLPILAGDIPWSAGGLMRCFDLDHRGGHAQQRHLPGRRQPRPDRARRGSPAAWSPSASRRCSTASLELGRNVQATCCGTWDTAVIAGLDERGEQPAPFLSIIMEPMAGGYGARPHADGIDTGGLFCIPMGRMPDVEMTEFLYPVLTLWRREEPDSGGPGRHRGGRRAPRWRSPRTAPACRWGWCWPRRARPSPRTTGSAGGYPGNTGLDVVARGADVAELLAAGHMPADLDEVWRRARTRPELRARPTWPPARCSTMTGRAAAATATRSPATRRPSPTTCGRARSPRSAPPTPTASSWTPTQRSTPTEQPGSGTGCGSCDERAPRSTLLCRAVLWICRPDADWTTT